MAAVSIKLFRGKTLKCNCAISRHYGAATATSVPTNETKNTQQNAPVSAYKNYRNKSGLKMCGWQMHGYGDINELQYSNSLKVPQIRNATDCLVRVHTTTVNPIDVAMLGGYGAKVLNVMRCQPTSGIEFPLILGREFCGEVVQRGMAVGSSLAVGDRVWGVVPLQLNGAHAEYVTIPQHCLLRAPVALSDIEATSVLYGGLTAWSGLYVSGNLGGVCGIISSSGGGAQKRVLVLGGSGSVGSLAIQILKANNVQVLATSSEDAEEMVRNIGADCVVDYKNPVAMETLRNYAPFDIVLDCAGQGPAYAETLNFKFHQYITFSSPLLHNIDNSGLPFGIFKNFMDLLSSNAKALSNQQGLVKWGYFLPAPQGIELLQKLVDRNKLLPLIDSTYKLDQLPNAFKKVQNGHLRGKVVVDLK